MGIAVFSLGLVFVLALLDGAVSDLRGFTIFNRVPLVLAASYGAALALGYDQAAWLSHLGAGLLLLAIGVGLFALGIWGGGDAKMLSAAVLWPGFGGLARFLLVMAVVGGGLAVLALVARRIPLGPAGPLRAWGQRLAASGHVPYGVAIAAGGLDWWLFAVLPGFTG